MPPPRQDWQVSRAWPSQPSRLASFQAAAAIIAGPCARNSSSTISDGVYCMRRAASVKIRRANGDNLTSTGTAFTTASSIGICPMSTNGDIVHRMTQLARPIAHAHSQWCMGSTEDERGHSLGCESLTGDIVSLLLAVYEEGVRRGEHRDR